MDEQVKILLAAQDQISKVLDAVEGKLDQVVATGVEAQKALQKVFDKKFDAVQKQTNELKQTLKSAQAAAKVTNSELKVAFAKKNAAVLSQVKALRERVFNARKEAREADAAMRQMFKAKTSALLQQIRSLRTEVEKLKKAGQGGIFGAGAGGLAGGILGRGSGLMAGYGLGRAFGIYGGLAGAIYSVQRGMAESIRTTAEYRTAMQYAAAVANATREQTSRLNDVIRELGALTEFTASQVADGARFLAQAGFTFQEVLTALPGMLELAAAGSMDLGQAADITTNILRGFNLEVERLTEVADVLAHVASTSNTNIAQMGQAFSYAAPTARAAGEEFHEVSAALAILADAGIRGERAGTSLRQAYIRLQSMPESVAKEFKELGIQIRNTSDGTIDLSEVIEQLAEKNVQLPGIFQARALAAMQQLVLNADRLRNAELDVVLDSVGRASQIAEQKLEGMPRLVRQLASAWEDLKLDIGESDFAFKLVEDLRGVVRWLANVEDPVDSINKSLDLFASEFENRLDLIGPRADDLVRRIEELNNELVRLGEEKRHVFGVASSFPAPAGFGAGPGLGPSFTASQAEEAYRRWEAMQNRARDRAREDDEERETAERARIDRLKEVEAYWNAARSAEQRAVQELVRLWAERDHAEAEAVQAHWERLESSLEVYRRVSAVFQQDLQRFHTVGIQSFTGPVSLVGGPDANAGLKEAEKLWESGAEKLRDFRQVVQLTAQSADGMAADFLTASAQVVQSWIYMTNAIRAQELSSVVLAAIAAVLSMVNALSQLGKTSQDVVDTNAALVSSLDAVRSGTLTAAEAIERYNKWKGNEEGHQFLLNVIDDFKTIGRTAKEAEDIVGDYWDAMQRGDTVSMERIGNELIFVADQAAATRKEIEESIEKVEELGNALEDAFGRARDAVEDYLIASGAVAEDWLDRQENIAQDVAGAYGLVWDTLDERQRDLWESIAENHGVSMDQILEDGIVTADEFMVIWGALPDQIQAIFALALERMGFDLSTFLSEVSSSIDAVGLAQQRERERLAREAEREAERRAREREREAERIAQAIARAVEAGLQRIEGMLDSFLKAGTTANQYLESLLSMLANPIWERIGMVKEDFEALIHAANSLGVALVDLLPDLNFAVLKEQIGNIGELFDVLIGSGIEATDIVNKISDDAVLAIGQMVDAAIAAGVPLEFIRDQFGGLFDEFMERYRELADTVGETTDEIEEEVRTLAEVQQELADINERLLQIQENRALRRLDAQEKALREEYDQRRAVLEAFIADEERKIEERKKAYLEQWQIRMDLLKDEQKAAMDGFDAEKKAIEDRQKVYVEQWQRRVDMVKDEHRAKMDAINAEIDALRKQQEFTTEGAWKAARAFGWTDRSKLGGEYQALWGRERIQEWGGYIQQLRASGLSDQALAQDDIIQKRMARIAQDAMKYGLEIPKVLGNLAKILGYDLPTSKGIEDLEKDKKDLQAEFNKTLKKLNDERAQIESNFEWELRGLAQRRADAEREFNRRIQELEDERVQILENFEWELKALHQLRIDLEAEFQAKLAVINMQRQAIEDARLAREIERENVEEQRLLAERELLSQVLFMLSGIGGERDRYRDTWEILNRGSGGLTDYGSGTPAMLHRREAVLTEESWMNAIERAAAGGNQGGHIQVVKFEVGGLGFGKAILRWQPKAAHLDGVR